MRKAKSRSLKVKRQSVELDEVKEASLSLVVERQSNVDKFPRAAQSRYYGMAGSIRKLMAVHNALLEQSRDMSASNTEAIFAAAATLEAKIDQKIDAMNEFLKYEEEKLQPKRKSRRASRRKQTRLQKIESTNNYEKSKKHGRKNSKKAIQKKARRANSRRAR